MAISPSNISKCNPKVMANVGIANERACDEPPIESGSSASTADPQSTACTIKCAGRSGVCHRSRPSHCPKRNAVYDAAQNPTITVGHNKIEVTKETPATAASQNTPHKPLYAIRTNAPRASHDLLCGVSTTRRNRSL